MTIETKIIGTWKKDGSVKSLVLDLQPDGTYVFKQLPKEKAEDVLFSIIGDRFEGHWWVSNGVLYLRESRIKGGPGSTLFTFVSKYFQLFTGPKELIIDAVDDSHIRFTGKEYEWGSGEWKKVLR
ncbi:hypothetical protein [Methylomonas sp. CM2]|uniref:hypothetical protein n=1 Tax=Methylomonas sp. CM2 TaxID=3417647 RepID=UPI003CF9F4A9